MVQSFTSTAFMWQGELAICKASTTQLERTALDAQEVAQSMRALDGQVCLLGRRADETVAAMSRLAAQQAANNHSMAVVAAQQVQLQARVDALEQAQAGGNPPSLLGRLAEVEDQLNLWGATLAIVEMGQEHLKQAWEDRQERQAKEGMQDAFADQLAPPEEELTHVKQHSLTATKHASRAKTQHEDVQAQLESQRATLATMTEQQTAIVSSVAALEAAHAALAAGSGTRTDTANADLASLEGKVAEVAADLQALADKGASPLAPLTDALDQESKVPAAQQHLAQELAEVKSEIKQLNLAMVSEASKFASTLEGLSSAQSSTATTVSTLQAGLSHASEELTQLNAAVKKSDAAALETQQHASSCVDGLQAQVGAWTSSMEALEADHELAAEETSKALKTLARVNADNRAMQHAQLELAADCSSQQAAIAQLQAACDGTTANMVSLHFGAFILYYGVPSHL